MSDIVSCERAYVRLLLNLEKRDFICNAASKLSDLSSLWQSRPAKQARRERAALSGK